VRGDEIELAPFPGDLAQVAGPEREIGQVQIAPRLLALRDRRLGQVDAHEPAARQIICQADKMRAGAAADFQVAALVRPRRLHSAQAADGGQAVGMHVEVDTAEVGNLIVGFGHDLPRAKTMWVGSTAWSWHHCK
jgi:hypothetical protein